MNKKPSYIELETKVAELSKEVNRLNRALKNKNSINQNKSGFNITLRTKPIKNKKRSLYLDIYPEIINPITGRKTRRDFLGLFLYDKPKTPSESLHNKKVMEEAERLRNLKDDELNPAIKF